MTIKVHFGNIRYFVKNSKLRSNQTQIIDMSLKPTEQSHYFQNTVDLPLLFLD